MKSLSPLTASVVLPVLATLLFVALVLALPPRAHAAAFSMVCEDAQAQPQTVSPSHPCAMGLASLFPVAGSQEALAAVAATALTVPPGAVFATITVEGASVRYRCDGTAPTASSGSLIGAGTQGFVLQVNPLSACQFIQTTPTGTLDVEYWHQ